MSRVIAGEREVDIAEAMGMHPASVSRIVHDALFQDALKRVMENTAKSMQDLRKDVAEVGVDALVSLSKLLRNEKVSARVRFKIAKLILDTAGLKEI